MRTEEEIKLELTRSEYLYKLKQNTREYTKHYYQAGYSQALKVVLGKIFAYAIEVQKLNILI